MLLRPLLLITLILITYSTNAQSKLDEGLLEKIENRVEKKAKQLRRQLLNEGLTHPIYLEYQLDQFRIEEYVRIKTEADWSTAVYIQELTMAEKRYQVILSKYYNKLMAILLPEDAQVLEQSHTIWLSYRKQEMDLNVRINPEQYGTGKENGIESVAERHLDITKYRLSELIDYIARTKNEEKD